MTSLTRPRVYLDIVTGISPVGRVTIELLTDHTPKTCTNFRALCTSSYTPPKGKEPLTYKLAPFHRIIDDFMVQGGDITAGDGTGGESIYGGDFADENIGWREIDAEGLVCMANRGKGTNTSQFFITLAPCQHLNAKHTIFGHVVGGMDVVRRMGAVAVDKDDKPLEAVLVANCGELDRKKKSVVEIAYSKDKLPGSSDRGRKRRNNSGHGSDSDSAHEDENRRMKHYRKSRSPEPAARKAARRRSDVEIDETRRGRALTRSPSPTLLTQHTVSDATKTHHKRNLSPSRSRSGHRSPSPHLRRRHTRSRDRSPVPRGPVARYGIARREDEYQIRKQEEEREGGKGRYEDVIEDEDDEARNSGSRRRDDRHRGREQAGGYGRIGGGGGSEEAGGEVKFKGRGSMKYRENKW